jgi:hypothetical protein
VSKNCAVIMATDHLPAGEKIYITLQLWKRGKEPFTMNELSPIKEIRVADDNSCVKIIFNDGNRKIVSFN